VGKAQRAHQARASNGGTLRFAHPTRQDYVDTSFPGHASAKPGFILPVCGYLVISSCLIICAMHNPPRKLTRADSKLRDSIRSQGGTCIPAIIF